MVSEYIGERAHVGAPLQANAFSQDKLDSVPGDIGLFAKVFSCQGKSRT